MTECRCIKCNKKLGTFRGQAEIKCPRCGVIAKINTEQNIERVPQSATK
jgi:phage FluMu protein Com